MDEFIELKLMDASNNYTMNIRKGYPRVMDETDKYILAAFEAGAKWYMDIGAKISDQSKSFMEIKEIQQKLSDKLDKAIDNLMLELSTDTTREIKNTDTADN